MSTNGRVGVGKGTKKSDDLLGAFKNLGKDILEGYEAAIEQAINKGMAIREFGTAGTAGIDVRHEGLLQRENPEDRKRYEALKANRDRGYLSADHIKILGGFAAKGQEFVLDVGERLIEDAHKRPAEVQPLAATLSNASMTILSAAFAESLKLLAQRGFEEIDQATPPGQRQQ